VERQIDGTARGRNERQHQDGDERPDGRGAHAPPSATTPVPVVRPRPVRGQVRAQLVMYRLLLQRGRRLVVDAKIPADERAVRVQVVLHLRLDHPLLEAADRPAQDDRERHGQTADGRGRVCQRYAVSEQPADRETLVRIVAVVHRRSLRPARPLDHVHHVVHVHPRPGQPGRVLVDGATALHRRALVARPALVPQVRGRPPVPGELHPVHRRHHQQHQHRERRERIQEHQQLNEQKQLHHAHAAVTLDLLQARSPQMKLVVELDPFGFQANAHFPLLPLQLLETLQSKSIRALKLNFKNNYTPLTY